MKKKLLLLSILLTGLTTFTSCSSNDSGDDASPSTAIVEPLPITITATSSEVLTIGENLEITGTNFFNKDYPTKIFINGTETTVKEISNTKIVLSIPEGLTTGTNTLRLQIKNVSSKPISFYSITKGWTKLTTLGNLDIQSSSVLDNSKTIFSFVNNITSGDGSFWGAPKKLEAKSKGYEEVYINQAGSYGDFKMIDDKTGALTNTVAGFFTDNGFETQKTISVNNRFSPAINGVKVGYLDNNICILTTMVSGQIYTADKGATTIKSDPPSWATIISSGGGVTTRLSISAFGKSVSDNKFYQLGLLYDSKNGLYNSKNVILQSETGYNNWVVKDSISKQANSKISSISYKFVNINKILALNVDDKSLYASTDMLQTWNVIKADVKAFFLRTETQWYIQSGDKLFVTKNSGTSWELELELPAGSVVNDISFAKNKIIVSGNKGLHYLKLE
ncbi:IPT/TIG domain-containing protein [Flavobacterium hydatis]|uniref:IPT/TIG domain-containing protein n=1 Tax=Flavobacterium hydatis TaxID=991 RepID=A0A086ARR2_FLAHY|nr:IPT/TIG domain-containing protein [Flavobacterium hydatis]KFF19376.1 hypothetical protein IW20_02510 [Flavobacterium hydatis]OXA96493.1 hypothetical protein B0A62_04315 [Flavobacterium hydatis]